jgi:hypothetical protein
MRLAGFFSLTGENDLVLGRFNPRLNSLDSAAAGLQSKFVGMGLERFPDMEGKLQVGALDSLDLFTLLGFHCPW